MSHGRTAPSARLLVDARKAFDSGIGTYVRSVLPRVLKLLGGDIAVRVLVARGDLAKHHALGVGLGGAVEFVELGEAPLSVAEQVAFRRVLGRRDCFWATSLAHPLFTRTAMVATVHDVAQLALPGAAAGGAWVRRGARLYFASLRRAASALLFDSAYTQSQFHRHVGPSDAPESVVALGVEPVWFEAGATPAPAPGVRPYLVCVGNLRPHKNLRLLISAFAAVQDRMPHELVLIGKASGFRTGDPGLQQALAALGARARWLGDIGDAELRAWVAGADAMVLPSLHEGFGLPALEAMAAGCPVLASDIGAHVEVCADAVRYFDPQSSSALGDLLLAQASLAPAARAAWRARGRQRARQFSWDETAARTAAALDRLVRSAR